MFIGFLQRYQDISENAGGPLTFFPLSINVSTPRASERNHTVVFWYLGSSSTAIVVPVNEPEDPLYDAKFGCRKIGDHPIEVTHILYPGKRTLSLTTTIRNDNRPEDQECYTISIYISELTLRVPPFRCNDDYRNPTEFFCDHTICIIDDDGQLSGSYICYATPFQFSNNSLVPFHIIIIHGWICIICADTVIESEVCGNLTLKLISKYGCQYIETFNMKRPLNQPTETTLCLSLHVLNIVAVFYIHEFLLTNSHPYSGICCT